MFRLRDTDTGACIGTIDDATLRFLIDHTEEEPPGDLRRRDGIQTLRSRG